MSAAAAAAGGGGTGGENNQQWAWLGLLKWTLAHQDGTVPSEESPTMTMMSDDDKAFLEKVMSDGIIDEGERMKVILQQFSSAMEYYKKTTTICSSASTTRTTPTTRQAVETHEEKEDYPPPPNEDDLEELLQELRDIVEQVDYARGFINMKGCQYLLGAISATTTITTKFTSSSSSDDDDDAGVGVVVPVIPTGIRNLCLGIVATLAQNNPPVQKELVELGAIKILSDMFLHENGIPLSTQTKIMQTVSAIVRCYDLTEAVFEALPQAPVMIVQGLASPSSSSNNIISNNNASSSLLSSLNLKTLFFLRAFLTSDTATNTRANTFRHAIAMIADTESRYLNATSAGRRSATTTTTNNYVDVQIRESTLALLQQLLERRFAVALLLERKQHLASLGVQRIQTLRSVPTAEDDDDDNESSTQHELEHWETFLIQLARTEPEEEEEEEEIIGEHNNNNTNSSQQS